MPILRCFACDRVIRRATPLIAHCLDEQEVYVGTECMKKIESAASEGWQPAKGGPRLFTLLAKRQKLQESHS